MTLRPHAPRRTPQLAHELALLLAAMTFGLSGCDNPVCVFGAGCQNQGGGPGSGDTASMGAASGTLPSEGSFLAAGAPQFLRAAPGGVAATTAHAQTPIFLEFSESLNPASLIDFSDPSAPVSAFQMIATISGSEIPLLPPQLVGDGRVVVLFPVIDYPELQNFQLFFREGQQIADLNGQLLGDDIDTSLVDLAINSAAVADTPRVIYSYPPDNSINNADTSEIVIGFDRAMDGTTIDTGSFAVTVDGAPPAFNPEPEAITVLSAMGGPTLATEVFTYTPIMDGRVVPYGTDADVVVRLSDSPDEIVSVDGAVLPLTETAFTTADFTLPSAVVKAAGARPENGFGRGDVFGTAPMVDVTFDAAPPEGAVAEFYLFGVSPQDPLFQRTLVRNVPVPSGATSLSVTSMDLGLFDTAGLVQYADGPAQVAVVLRSNGVRSAAVRFDADPSTEAIESPIFDTTPPEFLGLGATGDETDAFFGEVRDFAAFGRATEPIAFAFVEAGVDGNNGGSLAEPPATAFSSPAPDGSQAFFIAAPIEVGVLDPNAAPVSYEITIFDEAFNSVTESVTGTFTHRGVVGPGGAPTGSTVSVRVFDAVTLEPIENALVLSYQELNGGITFVDDGSTVGGAASVSGAGTGSTIITVDAAGYDLFSFHGVPRDAVDIMLEPTMLEASTVSGRVFGEFTSGLTISDRFVQDTRTLLPKRFQETGGCGSLGDLGVQCVFNDFPVRPGRLGGLTVVGVSSNVMLTPATAPLFLTSFALGAPFGPLAAGDGATGVSLDAGAGLTMSGADAIPQFFGATAFTLGGVTGLGTLQSDPVVTVEGAATGLAGALLIGAGETTVAGSPTTFAAVSAVAGVAAFGGNLELTGALSPESFMRISALDMSGNEVVSRPRRSNIQATAVPMSVPVISNPVAGSMTGGPVYNLQIADVLPDSAGLSFGLYRVQLTDTTGRGWTLVGLDTSDAAGGTIVLSVQNIAAQGGSGLQNGEITATVEVFAQDLDRGQFLWTDLEREHELYSRAAEMTFTQN